MTLQLSPLITHFFAPNSRFSWKWEYLNYTASVCQSVSQSVSPSVTWLININQIAVALWVPNTKWTDLQSTVNWLGFPTREGDPFTSRTSVLHTMGNNLARQAGSQEAAGGRRQAEPAFQELTSALNEPESVNDKCYHLRIGSNRATAYTGWVWLPD